MLNQETKRKIDTARDILVGKVPDPKAQVEQITTTLIYKFMDDMDKESEELGGKPRFFVKEFEKYAWTKLFDSRLGGFERLNLYVEALLKMPQNPYIPQLFRDILKDAFLPYRDPETLNLFLKEINEFTYDHSEKLGDAYEYLLSVLGSQGDAGQFRTPRHIIDFIVEVINPKKDETILDPACGTAGFLISAYKHILRQNTEERLGDQLTPDEKKKLMNHFMGYDISPDMVRLSLTNMYLHSFPSPNIYEYDTLTSEERWDDTYDVIMANPPFMSPKGGIRPHKRFTTQATRSEVLFVDYIAEHLNVNGRAGVIVPEGIIFQSGGAYKSLRKMLVDDNYLYAVVSLPAGIFQPYSGVKTSILLMDKSLAKKTDSILFVKVNNDGFGLGAQRRVIEKNDLPQALAILQCYKQALQNREDPSTILKDNEVSNMVVIAKKAQIAKNGDYNLSGERYKDAALRVDQKWPMVDLGEVSLIISGQSPEGQYYNEQSQGLPFYQGKADFGDLYVKNPTEWTTQVTKEAIRNDVLISVRAPVGPVNLAPFTVCIGRGLAAIRPNAELLNYMFLFYLLRSAQEEIKKYSNGSTFESINRDQIGRIRIPLPPLEVQQEIVAELENYQKIIDGAKQVVENYKPIIKVNPRWEHKTLQEVCVKITDGTHQTPTYENSGVIFLSSKNVTSGRIDWEEIKYISQELHEELSKHLKPQLNDILLAKNGTTGVAALVNRDIVFDIYVSLALLRPSQLVLPDYLLYIINSDLVKSQFNSRLRGIGVPNLHLNEIREVTIPVPPLNIQKQIVEQIEQEQKLVDGSKKLIEIFEQKIKEKIAEVWREDTSSKQDEEFDTLAATL